MACFVLAQCCAHGGDLRNLCVSGDLFSLLAAFCKHRDERLRVWCALAAGNAWKEAPDLLAHAQNSSCAAAVAEMHRDVSVRVRAACAFALGTIRKNPTPWHLAPLALLANDGSATVRREAHTAALAVFHADPVECRKGDDHRLAPLTSIVRRAANSDPDLVVRRIAAKVRKNKTVILFLTEKKKGDIGYWNDGSFYFCEDWLHDGEESFGCFVFFCECCFSGRFFF
jgi:hypothetical protein